MCIRDRLSVGSAWIALNAWSALFVFLGAFFYAIVYTVWLKRRTWLSIVFGGLAGSWAVLAGAAAADPHLGAVPLTLAFVLFLWTPPHFWSLAIAFREDYKLSLIHIFFDAKPLSEKVSRGAFLLYILFLQLASAHHLLSLIHI